MSRPSNRDKILTEGLKVVHEHGFANASVRDIVHAAGVPQGSFTNHFASKEAFGLEIIDLYAQGMCALVSETLLNETLKPLDRLAAYIDRSRSALCDGETRNGCLLGNFAAEAAEHSDAIRARLEEKFAATRAAIATCLHAAVEAGDLPKDFDCEETAGFVVSSLQGANLLVKTEQSTAPIDRFKHVLFAKVLR